MKVLFRSPNNGDLEEKNIKEDSLEEIRELMKCDYVETIKIREDIICLVDEEGLLKQVGENFWYDAWYTKEGEKMTIMNPCWIVGGVVFCSYEEGELKGLSEEQCQFVDKYING